MFEVLPFSAVISYNHKRAPRTSIEEKNSVLSRRAIAVVVSRRFLAAAELLDEKRSAE